MIRCLWHFVFGSTRLNGPDASRKQARAVTAAAGNGSRSPIRLLAAVASGQARGNHGAFITGKTGTGPLASFPHYNTVKQIYLAAEAVNMLAQLSAWNVQQVRQQIASLLRRLN
jgi:hypothetical protein